MGLGLTSQKLLAIDWDRRDLRLVLVRPRADGIDLLKAVSVPIPADVVLDDAESLGAFLREAMRQGRASARRAMFCIPRDQVVLNTLSVPPGPAEELPSMVQFQVVKELPFAADQATLDFAVSGSFDPKKPCDVLVAAIRNEQLDFYRKVAHEAGLTIECIGLRPHTNLTAVLTKAPGLEGKALLVVEVGPQLTEIDIIRDGVLAFSRAASVALPELESEPPGRLHDSRIEAAPLHDREPDETTRRAVGDLMVEITRSFEAYRATEPGAKVDRIVVCGATGLEPQLSKALAARFAAQAELYTPDRALNLTPQRARELRGFSAVLGLALGHGGKGLSNFDFLHPKKPVSKRSVRLKKVPTAALTLAILVATGFAYNHRYIQPLIAEAEPLRQEVNEMKKEERAILDFKKQVEALEDWQKSEQYWPEVLVALTEVFPPEQEAVVTRLDFETRRPKKKSTIRPSVIRIRLRTAKMAAVNALSAKLRELGLVEVEPGRETQIAGRELIYYRDTSIEAVLPLRSRPKAADTSEQAETLEPEDYQIPEQTPIEEAATEVAPQPGDHETSNPGQAAEAAPEKEDQGDAVVIPEPTAQPAESPGDSASEPDQGAGVPKGGAS